jgi:pimeloyl-ACP methyl ester carboxylesterase
MASDILAIAEAEGVDRFGIWGWSQETIVAWSTARSAPDRVAAFIGTGDPDPRPWTAEGWAALDRALFEASG